MPAAPTLKAVALRVLIVEDDVAVRQLVADCLETRRVSVTLAATAAAALAELRHNNFDVAILDLALPDGSGVDVLCALREQQAPTHVIILSGASSEGDRVRALDLGADDYVVKPFFARELTARVLGVRRRQDVAEDTSLQHGGLTIDLVARKVTVDDTPITLTAREFDLLAFLAARPRRVVSRAELLRAVWQSAAEWQQSSTVTEHVGRLRSKIEADPQHPLLLTTVRGIGYRFDPPTASSTRLLRDDGGDRALFASVNRAVTAAALALCPSPHERDEADVRRGLDRAEFDVHYQPVVALDDLSIIAVEALVRWNHPKLGLLKPPSFLEPAERSGDILELGRVVFDKACRQMAEWRRAGMDLEVAINLSARQLADRDLFDDITATIAASGLDPHALWLEVTETTLVEDIEQATDVLERLTALGIRIAIDDFGTGWASLTYLKEFPVHALKIDQTFVDSLDHNSQDAAIVRSIVSLGEELDLVVIAEGVETIAQQSALLTLGCSIGQGFLYGHPGPAEAIDLERANRR